MFKITVIVPCYNQGNYLDDCLQSVLNQTYKNWECIIINDGSTDDTDIKSKLWCQKDERFIYLKKENGGLSSARNIGITLAKGDFIQFLDSDDVIEPNKLYVQIELHKVFSDVKLSYTNFYYGRSEKVENKQANQENLVLNENDVISDFIYRWETDLTIPPHCFLVDLDFIRKNQICFDENCKNHEDFDFWLEILYRKPSIRYINDFLCTYRCTPNSMSKNMRLMGEGFLYVLDKHLNKKNIFRRVLKTKLRNVIISYRRFDKMNFIDVLYKFKSVGRYYVKRVIQKIFEN